MVHGFRGLNPWRLYPILLIEHGSGSVWLIFNYWETGSRERRKYRKEPRWHAAYKDMFTVSTSSNEVSTPTLPPYDIIILFMNTLRA